MLRQRGPQYATYVFGTIYQQYIQSGTRIHPRLADLSLRNSSELEKTQSIRGSRGMRQLKSQVVALYHVVYLRTFKPEPFLIHSNEFMMLAIILISSLLWQNTVEAATTCNNTFGEAYTKHLYAIPQQPFHHAVLALVSIYRMDFALMLA